LYSLGITGSGPAIKAEKNPTSEALRPTRTPYRNARGFMRGMQIRHDGWAQLVNDDEHGGCLIPMMMLYHEHDEDPEMRPQPIDPEKREDIIAHMAAGLLGAYRYFSGQRESDLSVHTTEARRNASKVGRNDPCPCGSGKKYSGAAEA
jgi:uncharacterized protein